MTSKEQVIDKTENVCNVLVHSQRVIDEIDNIEDMKLFSNSLKFHGKKFREELIKGTDQIFNSSEGNGASDMLILFDLHNNIHKSIDELTIEQKEILMNALPVLVKEIQEHGALFINGNNVRLKKTR